MERNSIVRIEGNKLTASATSESIERSYHIWRIDDIDPKNRERVAISGWQWDDHYEINLVKPGQYYAVVYYKDGSQRQESIPVFGDVVVSQSEVANIRQNDQAIIEMLSKMTIAGLENILKVLKVKLAGRKVSVYVDSLSETVFGQLSFALEFFLGELSFENFYVKSKGAENIGYKFSINYRNYYKSFSSNHLNEENVLLVAGTKKSKVITKAKVIYLKDLINEAFNNRVLVAPLNKLQSQNKKVLYVVFPTATKIKNKSVLEEKVSQLTIATTRANLKQGIIPEALLRFGENKVYANDVLDGWGLQSHEGGYDTLTDKTSTFVNRKNGYRLSPINEKENKDNKKVYFFGNSVMYGIGSDDVHTLPNLVGRNALSDNKSIYVENRANFSMNDYVRSTNLLKQIDISDEDIIVFGTHLALTVEQQNMLNGEYIDMQPYFERPHEMGEVFLDMTHMNKVGYEKMASVVYNYLVEKGLI